MTLGPVYTCDFSSLLRLFCDKMGVEPNWRIYRTTIARAQKPVKNRKYKRGLITTINTAKRVLCGYFKLHKNQFKVDLPITLPNFLISCHYFSGKMHVVYDWRNISCQIVKAWKSVKRVYCSRYTDLSSGPQAREGACACSQTASLWFCPGTQACSDWPYWTD